LSLNVRHFKTIYRLIHYPLPTSARLKLRERNRFHSVIPSPLGSLGVTQDGRVLCLIYTDGWRRRPGCAS